MPEIKLWCCAQGRQRPFWVSVSLAEEVDGLKAKINEKCPLGHFGSVSLWKPFANILVTPVATFSERIGIWFTESGLSEYAEELEMDYSVAQAFEEVLRNRNQTAPAQIDVIVQCLPQSKWQDVNSRYQRIY